MKKTSIMTVCDNLHAGTGFSEELRNIMYRLVQSGGYDVYWVGLQHCGYGFDVPDTVFKDLTPAGATIKQLAGVGGGGMGFDSFKKHYYTYLPDIVFIIGDPHHFIPYIDFKNYEAFTLMAYTTLDGLPLYPPWKNMFKDIDVPICMTEWAYKAFHDQKYKMNAYVHHGVNWQYTATNPERKVQLKKKYGIDPSTIIFGNWDTNQFRKRDDALLRAWKKTRPETKNMKLFLDKDSNCRLGNNLNTLIEQYDVPRDTIILPEDISKNKQKKFFDIADEPEYHKEICELFDVYVSATGGEGFGKCLHPNSLIITRNGIQKIRDVKIGMEVLSHEGKWVDVLAHRDKQYSGSVLRIRTWGNDDEIITPEHKILSAKISRGKYNSVEPKWIEAKDLCKGDIVFFPNYMENDTMDTFDLASFGNFVSDDNYVWYKMGFSSNGELVKVKRFIKIDEDLAKLVGIYCAEGSLAEISIGRELGILEEMKKIYVDKFGVEPKIYERDTTYRFCITQKVIQIFLSSLCGVGARNKCLTQSLLNNMTFLKPFVEYYWLGDGTKNTNGFTTVSLDMVQTLKLISGKLGLKCLHKYDRNNDAYRIFLEGSKVVHSNRTWSNRHGYVAYLIREIIGESYSGIVCDLQTPSESFCTLNFCVHNCSLEALSYNMPVIITDYSACPEVCAKGSILVPTIGTYRVMDQYKTVDLAIIDEDKLAEEIVYLYNSPSERKELGLIGRTWAKEFDYDTQIGPAWLDVFSRVNPDVFLAQQLLGVG